MSWRTRGLYKGLNPSEWKWLRKFNRGWDTKSAGRSRKDAFDHLAGSGEPAARPGDLPPEKNLLLLAQEVARFTVPRKTRRGWSIHLTLKSGERVRVYLKTRDEAEQAYASLLEASSMVSAA